MNLLPAVLFPKRYLLIQALWMQLYTAETDHHREARQYCLPGCPVLYLLIASGSIADRVLVGLLGTAEGMRFLLPQLAHVEVQ